MSSIITPDYMEKYVERGSKEHCGDWSKLPTSGQKGWQGRYSMAGRSKIRAIVRKRGYVWLDGKKHYNSDLGLRQ